MQILTTTQFDEAALIQDMLNQLSGEQYSAALVYIYGELDTEVVMSGLSLPKPYIGCTFLECHANQSNSDISCAIVLIPEKYEPKVGMINTFEHGSDRLIAYSTNDSELPVYCNHYEFTGGLAADNWSFDKTKVFINGKSLASGTVAMSLMSTQETSGRCGWQPLGSTPSKVTLAKGHEVLEIDGVPAISYYLNYISSPESFGAYPLLLVRDKTFRAALGFNIELGSITFSAPIEEGTEILITSSRRNLILEATSAAIDENKSIASADINIMVSCAARNLMLGDLTTSEFQSLSSRNPNSLVVYLYGEFMPGSKGQTNLQNQHSVINAISGA